MVQHLFPIPDALIRWRCTEYKIEAPRLHYGRFAISSISAGQANTLGVALRRALLTEIKGVRVTSATFSGVSHEYSALIGIQESIHDILLNLQDIVLSGDLTEPHDASISVRGPGIVLAKNIVVPSCAAIVDPNQYIANLTKDAYFTVKLRIQKGLGDALPTNFPEGTFVVNPVFSAIRKVSYSVYPHERSQQAGREVLCLEIWTDGGITPEDAFQQACWKLVEMFLSLLRLETQEKTHSQLDKTTNSKIKLNINEFSVSDHIITEQESFRDFFIEQLVLPPRAYNSLKKANVHTVADLLDYTEEELLKIKNFGKRSAKQVAEALEKHLGVSLLKQTTRSS